MIRAVIYDHTGVVTGARAGQQASVLKDVKNKNHIITDEPCAPGTHYVRDGELRPLPPKPHPVCQWDNVEETWQTPLDALREHKWAEILEHRNAAELAGFQYGEHTLDSDRTSQSRITAAATWAMNDADVVLDWVTKHNHTITLTATQIQEMAVKLGEHIVACHQHARQLKQQLQAASTVEEIHQIHW